MKPSDAAATAALGARALVALTRAGVIAPLSPGRLVGLADALRLGTGPHTLIAAGGARHPERAAIVDERGTVAYGELARRVEAVAAGLRDRLGVGAGDTVGLLCRNHRGFVEGLAGITRLGADVLLVNTDLAGPQLAAVLERERPAAVVHDAEFAAAVVDAGLADRRAVAWTEDGDPEAPTLDDLAAGERIRGRPAQTGRMVLLTSGTTGVPRSAARTPSVLASLGPATTLLSGIPLRAGEPMLVAPPLFHGLGFGYLAVGLLLGAPLVLRRGFDAEETVAAIGEHGVRTFVAVPVMLGRMLRCPDDERRRRAAASLRAVISGGSALPPAVSTGFMDAFGDVVYNLYGSTEGGFAALAGPADLRAAPGTVGRVPAGVVVTILDEDRREVPPGEVGHVFVGGRMVFEGYGGSDGDKERVDGLVNTGDLGHFDAAGRLMIDGREDDMIVSGGENVFPQEVADVLGRHEDVVDVAVIGVEDEEFGQRLRAFVVAAGDPPPDVDELKAHVKASLARYQVPREVVFVDELPRNPTGKIKVSELADAR
jgi:acyl-CoA synthetase (AMP-forming)/AMP-acid ligase II